MKLKIAFFIIVAGVSNVLANPGYSQVAKVSLDMENKSLEQVMDEIELQSEFYFIFNQKQIDVSRIVNIQEDNKLITDILPELFKGTNVNYAVLDRKILLTTDPLENNLLAIASGTEPQQNRITGTVADKDGAPLPGVNVVVTGTTLGAITDIAGKYSIEVPPGSKSLTFSFIGMESQEITIGALTQINVTMVMLEIGLEEVVVTGYSTERKKDIVGSVSVINADDLLSIATGNVTSQLQGRAAGVTVTASGDLENETKIRIRGFGSFTGSNPLFIVDGVPVSSGINNLNPNDIESLQVLKDASSASIYGARAANGVIIITTKKGKPGPVKVTVKSYYGLNYSGKNSLPDLLDAYEFGEMYWKSLIGAGLKEGDVGWGHVQYGNGPEPIIPEYILVKNEGGAIGGAALENIRQSDPEYFAYLVDPMNYDFATHQIVKSSNTDWIDESFIIAPQYSFQANVSGGSDNGSYMLSLNYFDKKSTVAESNFLKRYSLRSNASYKIWESIRVGGNVQLNFTNSNTSLAGPSGSSWSVSPLIPIYDIMGNPASTFAPGTSGTGARNTVTEAWRNRFDRNENFGIFGNVYGEYNIIKGLLARTSFGFDQTTRGVRDFNPITYEHAENVNSNSLSVSENSNNSWTWTNTLTFKRTFADKHEVSFITGTEAIRNINNLLSATRLDYPIDQQDNPNFHVLNAGTGAQTNSGSFSRNSLFSLFLRLDYAYSGKYLINATMRRDQSSKFALNRRTGYFPAVAIGWKISSESFMQNIEWLDDLKLRASWGIIGNQTGLDNENQFDIYVSTTSESYPISGGNTSRTDSYTMSRIGNPEAAWEENITTDIGIDASFFNNSLDLTVDIYNKKVKGLLVQNQAAHTGSTGTSAPIQPFINAGELYNIGIDAGLTKRGNLNKLSYEIGLIFSKYKNEVTKVLDNPLAALISGSTRIGSVTRTEVGSPIGMFYGYKIEGFFNNQEEVDAYKEEYTTWLQPAVGRWKIKDINGDKSVNALDRINIGSPHPDFQASLNLSLKYKNFDFNTFLFWNKGGDIFNIARYVTDFNTFNQNRSKDMLNKSWTPELGNSAKLPKLDIYDTYSNQNPTDYFVEDASYLRAKNMQLGYSLPVLIVKRMKLDQLRIYIQALNFFTITKFTGLDPDASLQGSNDLAMGVIDRLTPTPKQILFGIDLEF